MIGIIGGGISGLSVAYHLQKMNIPYVLLEKEARSGGVIQSIQKNGVTYEYGPNSLLIDDEILSFIKELNIDDQIEYAEDVSKNRFIMKDGVYQVLPDKPHKLLFSTFFSLLTKIKILRELFISKKNIENETLYSFFSRRFPEEIINYALQPFIAGIYAGDPKQLLIEKTFPMLKGFENKFGSVLKGLIKSKNKTSRKSIISFKKGLEQLIIAISENLNIQYNTSVKEILSLENNEYEIVTNNGNLSVNTIVFCVPAKSMGNIINNFNKELSGKFNKINYPPMSVIHTVHYKKNINKPLIGFGGLNPIIENKIASGHIWNSNIFKYSTPTDKTLITSFVGGVLNKKNTHFSDEKLSQLINDEISSDFNIHEKPIFQQVYRYTHAIPQYDIKIQQLHQSIDKNLSNNIYFSGNWIDGVSIPDRIKNGKKIANTIKEKISMSQNSK